MPYDEAEMVDDEYKCFSNLAVHETRGRDYDLDVRRRVESRVAVIAPHGGGIELETADIAEKIAGNDFSLYCFKGLKPERNCVLHITSHRFDEPDCLGLIAEHEWVLAIHGCNESDERILLGGLDKPLISDLAFELETAGIGAETTNHRYPGRNKRNICNRGARNAGAQFELSLSFRRSNRVSLFVQVVRGVLAERQNRERGSDLEN